MKNGKVEIIEDKASGEKRIASMICFRENGEILIEGSSKNNIANILNLQYLIVKD